MKPAKIRQLLSKYGEIGRVYLAPEDSSIARKRKKYRGNKRQNYTEGWVEFRDKSVARSVVEMINGISSGFYSSGQIIGGKKRTYYHDDIWYDSTLTSCSGASSTCASSNGMTLLLRLPMSLRSLSKRNAKKPDWLNLRTRSIERM